MKLRERTHDADFEVNLTPLIDVVFLLLIFFVLTTTFQKEARLQVDLPGAASGESQPLQQMVEVVVDPQGRIQLQGSDHPDWYSVLKGRLQQHPELSLVVRADRLAPHGAVVVVMDAARQLKLTKLSIVTEQKR
jgi:biopolymer transport protein ExbD